MDLYILPFLAPIGLYYCYYKLSDSSLFLGVYGVLAFYFSGVMIRLLLVLSPAACCLAGVGASVIVTRLMPLLKSPATEGSRLPRIGALIIILGLALHLVMYVCHATSMSSLAYSSPSIVMTGNRRDGSRVIQDDFREAYYWLRMNTAPDAKVLSWWDYGYQITAIGNRTVLVDNNTWNNTHIATVGLVLSSNEEDAYPILQKLDVDYVLVLYGGVSRYSSDDINKFLWPIRIASGVYPHLVQESDFIGPKGYTIDESATEKMKNSVMYKLCYYRAGEMTRNQDMVRNQMIGKPHLKPKYFEEAFTSDNWIVRIYRVKKPANRGQPLRRSAQ
jgi:dolichyl-diphosphooligosaccharide--protein glycosyltransferase